MLIRLTETDLKNIIHGVVTEILREPLYTNTINKKDPSKRNHSYVGRDKKYGISKHIGGEYYVHANYANRISQDMFEEGIRILKQKIPDFKFNIVVFPDKLQNSNPRYVKFVNCSTFDTDREPLRGEGYKINLDDGLVKRMSGDNTIYHHKWTWVDDDYDGFNVDDSYNWSKEWLNTLEEPANGNSLQCWNMQLGKYNLQIDKK